MNAADKQPRRCPVTGKECPREKCQLWLPQVDNCGMVNERRDDDPSPGPFVIAGP